MTNHDLEQKIRTAVEHAAPDQLETILSSCQSEKKEGAMIYMNENKKTNRKKYRLTAVAAAAAVLILCLGGLRLLQKGPGQSGPDIPGTSGQNLLSESNVPETETVPDEASHSIILLDVNPSLSLTVDAAETVLAVEALNDDAVEILGNMDLTGTSLEVALNAVIGSMLQKGYLGELQNSILVSVEDQDAARGAELQQKVSKAIADAMQSDSVEAAVLSQTVNGDDEVLAELARQYQISLGKAALIQEVISQIPTLSFDDLAPRSINEIALISASQNGTVSSVQQTGSASDKAYIGQEKALQLACAHAGVDASEILRSDVEFDWEDGVMAYEVEFETADREYEYDIDAITGELIMVKAEIKHGSASVPGVSDGQPQPIDESTAREAALTHAGIAESDTAYLHCYEEYDDGHLECYNVEFMAGNTCYEYEIDCYTGSVLECSEKNYGHHAETGQHHSESHHSSQSSTSYIGDSAALEIALNHAGIAESSLTKKEIDLDEEAGRIVYELELKTDTMEYEYEIDAITGDILKADSERDD